MTSTPISGNRPSTPPPFVAGEDGSPPASPAVSEEKREYVSLTTGGRGVVIGDPQKLHAQWIEQREKFGFS